MASEKNSFDVCVVGGGLVGAAVGLGLMRQGMRCVLLDAADDALRASRGNFGLVWVQSKGLNFRPYAKLSRDASDAWQEFASELRAQTGIDVGLRQNGGLTFCLSQAEFDARRALMIQQFDTDMPRPGAWAMLDRQQLREWVPQVGPDVVGASFCKLDGEVNPLRLYRALLAAFQKIGGIYRSGHAVRNIRPQDASFSVTTDAGMLACGTVVLSAGLGNAKLGPMVGLQVPVFPLRGQILVTEKQPSWLSYPTHVIRQTDEGGVIMGDSKEDTDFDDGTLLGVMGDIAARTVRVFPHLAQTNVIRAWGGLRVMTPKGLPLYQQSPVFPGAFSVNVHSGVTLAPVHTSLVARSIAERCFAPSLQPFRGSSDEIREPAASV